MRQSLLKMSFDFQELATHTELEKVLLSCSPRPLVSNSSSKGCIQDNIQNFPPNIFPHLQSDLLQITAVQKLAQSAARLAAI